MIRSFRCKDTEKLYRRYISKKFPSEIQRAALIKLRMIDNAQSLNDLSVPPGNRLEKLKGNRKGLYSIRINDQWRVCFTWKNDGAYDVEIVDYH